MTEVVAALDCGSNSTRLLTAIRHGETRRRETRITRLSQGVDASRRLTSEAMDRTFAVLDEYRVMMEVDGVVRGLLVATSAVRDAVNRDDFLAGARAHSGVEARLLTGEEEAWFSYSGAMSDLAEVGGPTAIVDVGGGSTEIAAVIGGVMSSCSMQLGCVRVAERALGRGLVTAASADAARAMIDEQLDVAFAEQPSFADLIGRTRLVGLAGTVTTLAQLDAGEAQYGRDVVHHRVLSRLTVQLWRDRLGAETPAQRLSHPGMVVGREDVLTAGLYVLDAVMGRLGVDSLVTSENDILDGVAASL
ncbi:MAG TPA: exopolyphosphatase [Acidimicrobiales bacterium]|nr:exopolyphosphatase [Acidimicrobiales bacterium]